MKTLRAVRTYCGGAPHRWHSESGNGSGGVSGDPGGRRGSGIRAGSAPALIRFAPARGDVASGLQNLSRWTRARQD